MVVREHDCVPAIGRYALTVDNLRRYLNVLEYRKLSMTVSLITTQERAKDAETVMILTSVSSNILNRACASVG